MKISAGYLTRDCVFISCLEWNNMQTTWSIEGKILVCDLNLFPMPCWGCDMVWYFNAVPCLEVKLDWVAGYSRVTAWLATKGVSSFQLQVSSITAMWVTLIEPKTLVFNFMHTHPPLPNLAYKLSHEHLQLNFDHCYLWVLICKSVIFIAAFWEISNSLIYGENGISFSIICQLSVQ